MFKLLSESLKTVLVFMAMAVAPLMLQSTDEYYDDGDDEEEEEEVSRVVATDVYTLKISLRVPQVLDNSKSTGVRKVKRQVISGEFHVLWHEDGGYSFETSGLYNRNFKVGGHNVTYTGYAGDGIVYPRFNYIGNNLTGDFRKPCLSVSLVLEPSYAVESVNEDNSFYLVLSGFGSSSLKKGNRIATSLSGYASGSQGCGCTDYGHKSPTREAGLHGPSETAADVVVTYGTWTMKWKKRLLSE